MPAGAIDISEVTRRLASRRADRTEANVQSDLHVLLLAAPLNLDASQLNEIVLEQQAGGQRRIDVEIGSTVFEVKRDLRVGNIRAEAVDQLAGYVASRSQTMGRRYVGVLTDGCEWHLYRLEGGALLLTSSLTLNPAVPDVEGLAVWLEAVLGTAEAVSPEPVEIRRRLGADSPGFRLDVAELTHMYALCRNNSEIALKRQLWSRLLQSTLGTNFTDDDELFVAHTYLVLVAELVAHAVVNIDLTSPTLDVADLLGGGEFDRSGIGGVVEADFFDWPVDHEWGTGFVRGLARRISRFDWHSVEHDVLKTLYESVIDDATRHRLGEYYTPDWLADHVVSEVVDDPLAQRVLDPSCGSGTFLFWSIRRYLEAADGAGYSNREAVTGVANHIVGIDLHPVAVTLARVTYLLAIGPARLRADRESFTVPVYLGDSIQLAEDTSILDSDGITIPTTVDQQELFAQEIRFPMDVVNNSATFDALVAALADRARRRSADGRRLAIAAVMNAAGVPPEHRGAVEAAYSILCSLYDARRDHIWGYYIRNLARSIWLSQPSNRADRLVGNPPWLRFNAMSAAMQENFRTLASQRGLWAGGAVATSQDLAALFVARSVELYMGAGGRFGFVMPASTLSRSHYDGFRRGHWNAPASQTCVAFDEAWDLTAVDPDPFPVPSCVVFGTRVTAGSVRAMPANAHVATAQLDHHHRTWAEVSSSFLWRTQAVSIDDTSARGFYGDLMRQGSNLVPRMLLVVNELPVPAMGLPAGQVGIESRRTNDERLPWRDLASLSGVVERQFVRRIHLGETLMPFRLLDPLRAVIPMVDGLVMEANSPEIEEYPNLAAWWRRAEQVWSQNKSENTRLTLSGQINYQTKLANQYPPSDVRVIYTGRGSRVAAAVETDHDTIVDHALYWAPVGSLDEGRYLVALLNSDVLHARVEDFYSRGQFGARNIHKAAFGVDIPQFDPSDSLHGRIVALSTTAEEVVSGIVPSGARTSSFRVAYRSALTAHGVMGELDSAIDDLIPSP
jgi:SAM-dependent methyltransferase